MVVLSIVELVIFCVGEGLCKAVWVRSNHFTGKHLISLLAGIFDCSTVRSLITQQCKGTEMVCMHLVQKGARCIAFPR